jgi:uncharacterized protein (TIGR03545 family)
MKGIIRWPGIAVAAVIVVLGYFVIEPLLKTIIEQVGTRTLSTRVTLDNVSVGWSDQSLALRGLEIADKDQPMFNLLEVDEIALQIDAFDALSGHLISEDAALAGIRFNTQRTTSGAVDDIVTLDNVDEKAAAASDSFSLPGLDLPDMDQLVSKENSLTYQRYKDFETYLEETKASFEKRIDALKDKKKIDAYKARYEEIKSAKGFMGKLKMVSKAKDLKEDIDADLKEAKQLKKDFDKASKEVKRRLAELKASPQQEADQLLANVGVEGGTQRISEMIFGPELKEKLAMLKDLKSGDDAEATPQELVVERGKGLFVPFDGARKLPAVWFKQARLSGDLNGLDVPFGFKGVAEDLSDNQDLTGKPITIKSDLINDQVKSANVNAVYDVRSSQSFKELIAVDLDVKDYSLADKVLSDGFNLKTSLVNAKGNIALKDSILSGKIKLNMHSVNMEASGGMFDKYPAIGEALKKEDKINAQVKLSGDVDDPQVRVNSNLDKVFNRILKKAVNAQIAAYKSELTRELEGMLSEQLSGSQSSQSDFFSLGGDIAGSEKALSSLLGGL